MFRRSTLAFPAAAVAAAVSVVLAAAPARSQTYGFGDDVDWTGPYAGLQAGRSIADMSSGDDDIGTAFGVQAGYRSDFGSFILGGEFQYDWTHLDPGEGQGSVEGLTRLKLDLGYGTGPFLFYGTFGATFAAAVFEGDDYDEWGWLGGIGVDYMLTDPVAIGFEVQHHGFGELGDTDREFDGTTVEAGITFRF